MFLILEIFNNEQQKMDFGEWGQTGNLSAELFPGVPELPVCYAMINVSETDNCTHICKEQLS